MDDQKSEPVEHKHEEFVEKAMQRPGFKEAYKACKNSETKAEMEKAKKGIDGRNVSLDEALSLCAKKVEEDQGLNDEMADWETTLGDGIEEDDNNP